MAMESVLDKSVAMECIISPQVEVNYYKVNKMKHVHG